jgi:hypothetical protein
MPDSFNVEKVLRKRVRNNKKEVFVRWQGYPEKFNDCIPEEDIGDIGQTIEKGNSKKNV